MEFIDEGLLTANHKAYIHLYDSLQIIVCYHVCIGNYIPDSQGRVSSQWHGDHLDFGIIIINAVHLERIHGTVQLYHLCITIIKQCMSLNKKPVVPAAACWVSSLENEHTRIIVILVIFRWFQQHQSMKVCLEMDHN